MVCAHALHAGVVLADYSVSDAHLEFLQTHDLLLQRASSDQPVHIDDPFLHRTDIVRVVSVMFYVCGQRLPANLISLGSLHITGFRQEQLCHTI